MSLTVAIAGSSGFLGGHLCAALVTRGHQVIRLVRRSAAAPEESPWDPASGTVDPGVMAAADVVVNLAGSPTLGNPHSRKWATRLRESRVRTTTVLAEAIAAVPGEKPAYLAGNGISWYGDHGPAELTEESDSRGDALLTEVCRAWQAATEPAVAAGSRVCVLRTAPVMDPANPPLKQQRLQFLAGLGGRIGSGEQYMPMISLRDWVDAVVFLAEHPESAGPVNLCLPTAPTNAEFTRALAGALRRPAFMHAPAFVVRRAAGAMGPELLGSLNVRPAALHRWGYEFSDHDVTALLRCL
jgi:uncharacterized protein (TIGR01777 family)